MSDSTAQVKPFLSAWQAPKFEFISLFTEETARKPIKLKRYDRSHLKEQTNFEFQGEIWTTLIGTGFKIFELLGPTHPAPGLDEVPPGFLSLAGATKLKVADPFQQISNFFSCCMEISPLTLTCLWSRLRTASFSFCFNGTNVEAQRIHQPDQVRNSMLLLPDLNVNYFTIPGLNVFPSLNIPLNQWNSPTQPTAHNHCNHFFETI